MFWLLLLPAAAPPTANHIEVVRPQRIVWHNDVTLAGIVKPAAAIDVVSSASGLIQKVLITEPRTVTKGTLLVQLDDQEAKLELRKAEAELARANAALKTAPPGVAAPAQATVRVAEANLELAKFRLERAQVRAPRDGRVTLRAIEGQMVRAGDTVLGTLEIAGPIRVELEVDAKNYRNVFRPILDGKSPLGAQAREVFVRQGGTFFPAKITHIDDRLTGKKETAKVIVEMPRSDSLRGAGTSAEVWVRQSPGFETVYTLAQPDFFSSKNVFGSRAPTAGSRFTAPTWPRTGTLFVLDRRGSVQQRTVGRDVRALSEVSSVLESGLEPGDLILREQQNAKFMKKNKTFVPVDVTDRYPLTLAPWPAPK